MDNLTKPALDAINALAKISKKENRPMVLITPGPHSEHYGFVEEATLNFIRFRTLKGGTVVVPWAPGTYVELLPAAITT